VVARRLAAPLLALAVALTCVAAAGARTPVQHPAKKAVVRLPAISGLLPSQWKTWWGAASFTGGGVTLASQAPVTASETHSALITSKRTWQDSTISFTTNTLQQLRRNDAPNVWEVGWVMFHFTDLENYYWFMLKTNGFELGKKQGSDTQIFLVTGDLPAIAVGQSRQIEVRTQGPRIRVFVEGTKYVDYVDPHPLAAGSVGLYEEDSHVRFDSVVVS
jgi:hypothetical protein